MSKRTDKRRSQFDQLLHAKMRAAVGQLWPGLPPVQIIREQVPIRVSVAAITLLLTLGLSGCTILDKWHCADGSCAKLPAPDMRGADGGGA